MIAGYPSLSHPFGPDVMGWIGMGVVVGGLAVAVYYYWRYWHH